MSDRLPTTSEQNRLRLVALEAQLTTCSEVAREIVVNVLRDQCLSTMLATELSALQVRLESHVKETRRLLGQWETRRLLGQWPQER